VAERHDIGRADVEALLARLAERLNAHVFPRIGQALQAEPSLGERLNPAFPFPKKVRVGLLDTHLIVEYVGPEDPRSETFETEGARLRKGSVFDFLGIDIEHLDCVRVPFTQPLANMQIFLGDAMALLGDYLYDILANPNDVMLNGVPDFTAATSPIFVSNVTFLWSDPNGALRVKRIDFMELMPVQKKGKKRGWPYHTQDSLEHFAEFIINYGVPTYRPHLHAVLNEFIQLVATREVNEPQVTGYLASHPEILQLAFGASNLNPQTELVWQYATDKSNLQPDFMPTRMDGYADILEFKLPRLGARPTVGEATRWHPSFEIDAALAQIDEYEEWCQQEVNRRWLQSTKGIKVLNPHTWLVIGHRDQFSAKDRQKLRGRRNATILTYDEFIEMARMQLYRVH
jgi:Domain of unknown function (DUF4263)